jgi:hypothetical protein
VGTKALPMIPRLPSRFPPRSRGALCCHPDAPLLSPGAFDWDGSDLDDPEVSPDPSVSRSVWRYP